MIRIGDYRRRRGVDGMVGSVRFKSLESRSRLRPVSAFGRSVMLANSKLAKSQGERKIPSRRLIMDIYHGSRIGCGNTDNSPGSKTKAQLEVGRVDAVDGKIKLGSYFGKSAQCPSTESLNGHITHYSHASTGCRPPVYSKPSVDAEDAASLKHCGHSRQQ